MSYHGNISGAIYLPPPASSSSQSDFYNRPSSHLQVVPIPLHPHTTPTRGYFNSRLWRAAFVEIFPDSLRSKGREEKVVSKGSFGKQRGGLMSEMATSDDIVPDEEEAKLQARGAWGGKFEFLLTCVGYAIGLGNVWRFPYLCYTNGGGAFLLPYILMLVVIGMPMFFLEVSLGQFSSLGPISLWSVSPIFKGLGFAMVVTAWMFSLYYIIIVAWAFYFFFASFTAVLPWSDCTNTWNTHLCIKSSDMRELIRNETALNITLESRNISAPEELKTPSEEYFYRKVLQMSDGLGESGPPVWELALCLLLTWVIVFFVLIRGIQSLGKVVYFTSLFPYVMLTILVVRGVSLEGANGGILYYLNPRPEKLADPLVWAEAATMVFFSIGTCSGGIIAMSSYNNFKHNFFSDSLIIPTIVGLTSFYSGFAIFTVLGFMAHIKGVPIDKVAAQGPGLVFVVYPEALSQMPLPPLWSVLFFIMLLTLGFSSEFSWVEAPFVAIMDEFPHIFRINRTRPIILRGVCISIYYLITLPMVTPGGFYLFSLTDSFVGGFPMLFIGLLELAVICIVYGYNRYAADVALMLGRNPPIFIKICWLFITPLILVLCVIVKCVLYKAYKLEDYLYPDWGQALGWMQVIFVVTWIPLWPIINVIRAGNVRTILKTMIAPADSWGPADPADRAGTCYDPDNPVITTNSHYDTPLQLVTTQGIPQSDKDVYRSLDVRELTSIHQHPTTPGTPVDQKQLSANKVFENNGYTQSQ